MDRTVVIAHQPACSNVLLVDEDGSVTRLYQHTAERCQGYARAVREMVSGVTSISEVKVGRGDAIRLLAEVSR